MNKKLMNSLGWEKQFRKERTNVESFSYYVFIDREGNEVNPHLLNDIEYLLEQIDVDIVTLKKDLTSYLVGDKMFVPNKETIEKLANLYTKKEDK